ncbi:MAG: DUF167 family protein [Woeseiaceae bacterium]
MSFYQWDKDGDALSLNLCVQPNAKQDEIIGEYGENLKVRITALPIDNKANKHLLKYLAKIFGVSPSRITLMRGENSRNKCVKIIQPKLLPEFIKKSQQQSRLKNF